MCTPSIIWGYDFARSLHHLECLQQPSESCYCKRRGHSSFSITWDTDLHRLAWLQGDIGPQSAIFLLVLLTTNLMDTTHATIEYEFLVGPNWDGCWVQPRRTAKWRKMNCTIWMPTLSGYHPWIGTCARTTIESGLKINDRSFTTITFSKGCHCCVHTRIAHIMSRTKFFEVMNAQGRRMIQCDKFGYFNTCLKSGSKTTLQQ
jgi:hypothetical protein